MAKKKPAAKKSRTSSVSAAQRIVLRTGEALVEAEPSWSAAEPEVVIGELDGPVGYAIANLLGDQVKGHTRVFAILNSDVQVRPATVMVCDRPSCGSSRHIAAPICCAIGCNSADWRCHPRVGLTTGCDNSTASETTRT